MILLIKSDFSFDIHSHWNLYKALFFPSYVSDVAPNKTAVILFTAFGVNIAAGWSPISWNTYYFVYCQSRHKVSYLKIYT